VHRLILRGGAGKIIDEEGNGINFNDKTISLLCSSLLCQVISKAICKICNMFGAAFLDSNIYKTNHSFLLLNEGDFVSPMIIYWLIYIFLYSRYAYTRHIFLLLGYFFSLNLKN
jgi:hypothetical protein